MANNLPIHSGLENSRHFATSPLVSPRNDIWETSEELITRHYPYLGSASHWMKQNFHTTRGPWIGASNFDALVSGGFSRTSLFLERSWREFWISFKFHKPVSKTCKSKNDIFCLLKTCSFPFWYIILRMRSWWRFYFFESPKMCLKIH